MRIAIRVVSLAALTLAIAWLAYRPGFDSAVATISALVVLLSSFLLKKTPTKSGTKQSQKVSSGSVGVQAGENIHIDRIEK